MRNAFFTSENLDWIWRLGIAQGFVGLMLLLSLVSFSIPYSDSIRPFFVLMPLYYWSIYRPSLIPVIILFALGLIVDFVSGFPIGLHAALFVILHLIVKRQRLFLMGQPYPMFWMGFAIVTTFVFVAQWLFFSLVNFQLMALNEIIASNFTTILFFPFIAMIMAFIQKILPRPPKGY